jgi:hypothetical protein
MLAKSTYAFAFFLMSALLLPAQRVPPPPKPADSGPSLEVTMKYIQDRLNGVNVAPVVTWPHLTYVRRVAIAVAQANPKDCTLSGHSTESIESAPGHTPIAGERRDDTDWRLFLRDALAVTVQTESDYELPATENVPMEIRPDHYHLSIKMQPGKTTHAHDLRRWRDLDGKENHREFEYDPPDAHFQIPDGDYANRLAKAIVHAIELCGGGDNDPFK